MSSGVSLPPSLLPEVQERAGSLARTRSGAHTSALGLGCSVARTWLLCVAQPLCVVGAFEGFLLVGGHTHVRAGFKGTTLFERVCGRGA